VSQLLSDLRAGGGIITSVQGGNNITVNTVGTVATVNVSGTTNHAVQVGNALGALTSIGIGLAGQVLTSNGPGLDPSFQALPGFALTFNGNTGSATPAANIIIFNTDNATPSFVASGNTLVVDFRLPNLALGSNLASVVGASQNVAMGLDALNDITSGVGNVAIGFNAAQKLTTGGANTAVGNDAMNGGAGVVTGDNNVAVGNEALNIVTSGSQNTAVGNGALLVSTTGNDNTAIGHLAGNAITSGTQNTLVGSLGPGNNITTGNYNIALGSGSLGGITTGEYNIAIGALNAGNNLATNDSSNILISNTGVSGDNNTIRIGTQGSSFSQQNSCFIAGIASVSVSNAEMVIIDTTTGELGSQAIPGSALTYTAVNTSPYVVLSGDQFLGVDSSGGAITVQLPNAPTTGRYITIKDSTGSANTNNITVTTVGGAVTIDGATSYVMTANYESVSVLFNGSNYEIY